MSLASTLGDRFKAAFAGRVVSVISGAILAVALARLLDPDEYGLLFLSISVFGTIMLFSKLGIAKSTARYIAEYKETNPGQLRHVLRFGFLLNLVAITVVCALVLVTYEWIAQLLREPDLAPFLLIGVFFIAFGTVLTFVRVTLQGFEAIKATAGLRVIDTVSRLILTLGLLVLGYGAIGALVGYILAYLLAMIVGLAYLYRRYYPRSTTEAFEPGLKRRIAEYAVPLTATNTANVLDKRIDTILVGFFIGPVAVAYYTIGKQVIEFIETPMSALGFTLSPTYEAQQAKGNPETAARIYEEALSHGLLFYIPAAAGLILVAEPVVELVFGTEYFGAIPVVQVLAIYAVLQSVTKLTSNGLDYLGRARERAIVKGVSAVLNVVLNVVLIPLIGVVGAAIATVVTYSMYTLANVYIIHTEFDLRVRFILKHIGSVLVIAGVMSFVVSLLLGYITGFLTLFGVVAVGVVVWAVLSIGAGLIDFERIYSVLF
ncbi:flippase [Halorubrum sp. DTA98]|uniref:flippase n=1 Tax=Halorubrum sp. DTA98 TaxID=3402163 RepID=UPI003AADBE23